MKITIISGDNLGYITLVENEMISQGHKVNHIRMNTLTYEYPNAMVKVQNAITKTFANYNLKREILAGRVKNELKRNPHQDLILIVSSDWLPTSIFKFISTKTDRLIGWFYDAVENYPRITKMIPYFDRAYTFEPKDATDLNIELLPNFNPYNRPIDFIKKKPFLYHVATMRDDRKALLTEIARQLRDANFPYEIILKARKAKDDIFLKITDKKIPLPIVYKNYERATVQIDIQRSKQEGLSFRVFEAMGMQHKLITTNSSISSYEFYNPQNILIIQPDNIQIPNEFLYAKYQPISDEMYYKYTLKNWVKTILIT